jgi:hypothetical protein
MNINQVTLFATPLHSIGLGPSAAAVDGVLGGDNLSRFACTFDYRGTPSLSLTTIISTCSCQLAQPPDCSAVFNFTLEGGQEQLTLGDNLYTYPPTRVVLNACLEPLFDPVSRDIPCATNDPNVAPTAPYLTSGVDTQLLVATGFPGLALGVKAYDRLRGPGAGEALIASSAQRLHLPDVADDGTDGSGLPVGMTSLGGGEVAALALVSREAYLGPCGELARSRRERRTPPAGEVLRPSESACLQPTTTTAFDPQIAGCLSQMGTSDVCTDHNINNPVAAVIELDTPIPTIILDDTAPILAGINADVRPANPTVEGIIGTELLQRLLTTIDYANGRLIARCATPDCLTYPRLPGENYNECGIQCTHTSDLPPAHDADRNIIPGTNIDATRPGALCPPL